MRNFLNCFLVLCSIFILFISCGEEKKERTSTAPNDSDLNDFSESDNEENDDSVEKEDDNIEPDAESIVCEKGYKPENGKCVDIDECLENICSFENGVCENLPGSYKCSCKAGFVLEGTKKESCVSRFDFEGPVYKGNVLLVINEATGETDFEFTGTLPGDKKRNLSENLSSKFLPKNLDVTVPLNPESLKFAENNEQIYAVGEERLFFGYGANSPEITATLKYQGTKSNIWVEKGGENVITDELAESIAENFDSVIFDKVTGRFGELSDVDNDGRVSLLFLQTNYPGVGKVGGYCDPNHLYDTEKSNKMEMVFVDYETSRNLNEFLYVIAHEFSHLVHYVRDIYTEKNGEYHPWIAEGIATAGEAAVFGSSEKWIDYYNYSLAASKGLSLLFIDWNNDPQATYALDYLFFRYLEIQAGIENNIIKEIIFDSENNYLAVERAAKKYIDKNLTFGELMTRYRLAILLKEKEGFYGYKGVPEFDKLKTRFYGGKGFDLRSGGAVYIRIDGEFTESGDKDEHIRYAGVYTGETTGTE